MKIEIPASGKPFKNNMNFCVGTGRMGLALQKEYLDHLELVQETIRFRYIRGHGLFCDDVGIYRELVIDGKTETFYNFTYLDRIMDSYLELGIRPFVELGFMPEKLKSGEQTVFYWKGNVTPPNSWEKWASLVEKTFDHLIDRYGREEVVTWPVEVWNEPNIPFWAGTMEEYFKLYDISARTLKKVDPRIQVGGPAICGVETEKWLRAFFEFCGKENSPLDFITRHCYTANEKRTSGQYDHHTINPPTYMIDELKETRAYMADYPHIAGLPLHITEFNSSYMPLCPVHDTSFQAAFIARILSEAGDYADSYSYWTFSDVFEESDVPKSQFHGGFGMLGLNSIKKPVFYTFEFFAKAGTELLYRDDNVLVTRDKSRLHIIAWSWHDMRDGMVKADIEYKLDLPSISKQAIQILRQVGGEQANVLQTWSNLGKPRTLNKVQKQILVQAAEPLFSSKKLFEDNSRYSIEFTIPCNQLLEIEILPVDDLSSSYAGYEASEFYGVD